MTDMTNGPPPRADPTLAEIAREEFWIVAKAFFAPAYGASLVLRHLARTTRATDRQTAHRTALERDPLPAE